MKMHDATSTKVVEYDSEQVQKMLEKRFGKEQAEVTICRFCSPESLGRCRECRHHSNGPGMDHFRPKYPPGVMENYIAAAA